LQNIKYALRFIKHSFQLALENEQLQKPWMAFSLGSLVLMLAAAIPLTLVIYLIGLIPIGMVFIGLISTFLVFGLRVWGEITALQTSQIFNMLIQAENDLADPVPLMGLLNRSGKEVLNFRLTYPILRIYHLLRRSLSRNPVEEPAWLNSGGMVLPVIALENLNLKEATGRVSEMVLRNLLRLRPSFIPVDLVSRMIEWTLLVIGIVLGFVNGIWIAQPELTGSWRMVIGGLVGLVIAVIFSVIGIGFSTFIRACYHTSLYRWAENVATAQDTPGTAQASPPAILGQVLGSDS